MSASSRRTDTMPSEQVMAVYAAAGVVAVGAVIDVVLAAAGVVVGVVTIWVPTGLAHATMRCDVAGNDSRMHTPQDNHAGTSDSSSSRAPVTAATARAALAVLAGQLDERPVIAYCGWLKCLLTYYSRSGYCL